jgi:hypothetical protein
MFRKRLLSPGTYHSIRQYSSDAIRMDRLNTGSSYRALITGDTLTLSKFRDNLTEVGIPSCPVPLENGKIGLETWYNFTLFAQKLDQLAAKTINECRSAQPDQQVVDTPRI